MSFSFYSLSPTSLFGVRLSSPSSSHMEPQMLDAVKLDKENPINCFRRIAKLCQFFEFLLLLGLISWSSARLRTAAAYAVHVSSYLFNHHVIFLIGNSIIVLLFLRCRQHEDAGDLYNDYVKHSEAAFEDREPADLPPPADENDKRIVDDVAAAIEKATRQIKRFERTQSEKLKREIRPQRRKSVSCGEEIESLSNEEFRRTVDAFIDQHWCRRKTKQNQFDEFQKYQLLKVES